MLEGLKSFLGRRTFRRKRREYHFQSRFAPIRPEQTTRHCYVHPAVTAEFWEMNTQDKSYKRPICQACFEEA